MPSSHQLPQVDVETEVEPCSLVPSQLGGAILNVGRFVSWRLGPLTKDDASGPVGLIFRILKHKTQELSSILKNHPTSSTHKQRSAEAGIAFPSTVSQGTCEFIG